MTNIPISIHNISSAGLDFSYCVSVQNPEIEEFLALFKRNEFRYFLISTLYTHRHTQTHTRIDVTTYNIFVPSFQIASHTLKRGTSLFYSGLHLAPWRVPAFLILNNIYWMKKIRWVGCAYSRQTPPSAIVHIIFTHSLQEECKAKENKLMKYILRSGKACTICSDRAVSILQLPFIYSSN